MRALLMFEGVLSDGEREKLRAIKELIRIRLEARSRSLDMAKSWLDKARDGLQEAETARMVATRIYNEALLGLAADDDDDFDEAFKKSSKFEQIEAEYLAADGIVAKAQARYDAVLARIAWEIKEGEKLTRPSGEK